MQRIRLTPGRITTAVCPDGKQQIILRDAEQPGLGLRVTRAGAKAFIFQEKLAGQVVRMSLGDCASLTLSDARDRAAALRLQVREGRDPRVVRAEKTAADLAARAKAVQEKGQSLKALLDGYCNYLEAQGRRSHKDARSIFQLRVFNQFPKLAAKAAARVTPEEIADVTRKPGRIAWCRIALAPAHGCTADRATGQPPWRE
jgi:hypothetical protein